MLRKLCRIVLIALLLTAIVSPILQLDSWDSFPASSDDIECQVTYCLCIIGMMLVFTSILKFIPMWKVADPLQLVPSLEFKEVCLERCEPVLVLPLSATPPLRI